MAEGKTPNAEVGEMNESSIEGQCPMRAPYPTESARTNESWWPKKLNLRIPVSYTHLTLPTNREV